MFGFCLLIIRSNLPNLYGKINDVEIESRQECFPMNFSKYLILASLSRSSLGSSRFINTVMPTVQGHTHYHVFPDMF